MIPAGYLLRRVKSPPDWLDAPRVADVCSISSCCVESLVDVQTLWLQNGFGLANDPEVLWRRVREGGMEASDAQLFYYEVYEQEMDCEDWLITPPKWRPLSKIASSGGEAAPFRERKYLRLMGYDVSTFGDCLECSPLSCNSMAKTLPVNEHCLFPSLTQAVEAVETGAFEGCEPGVYKIFAVYLVGLINCMSLGADSGSAVAVSADEGIRQGLADMENGRTRPASEVFTEIRAMYDIPRQ